MSVMENITVERYESGYCGWQGCISPADRSWIVFIDPDGKPVFWGERDEDGAVVRKYPDYPVV